MFTCDNLVTILTEAWGARMPLAHNWKRNPWPDDATSIFSWCEARGIDWGAPAGFPVQKVQRTERGQPRARIVAWQEPGGHRRIMFSLSKATNREAFEAASRFAARHRFLQLIP